MARVVMPLHPASHLAAIRSRISGCFLGTKSQEAPSAGGTEEGGPNEPKCGIVTVVNGRRYRCAEDPEHTPPHRSAGGYTW